MLLAMYERDPGGGRGNLAVQVPAAYGVTVCVSWGSLPEGCIRSLGGTGRWALSHRVAAPQNT